MSVQDRMLLRTRIITAIARNVGARPCHTNFAVAADEILGIIAAVTIREVTK